MKTLRQSLLTLSFAALSLGGPGCAGSAPSEEETLVGEAASALTVGEESGDPTADAVAAESDEALAADAESASLLPQPGEGGGFCDVGARRARVMAHFDVNHDGQLGPAERQALRDELEARTGHPLAVRFGLQHRAHVMKRLRWVFDENGDGALSADERTAMMDALEARCLRLKAAVVERFDANGDGQLGPAERQAARDAFVARLQALRQQVLGQYDANGNGVLDEPERQQLRADRVAAFQARRAAVIAEFDADGDGALSDAEKLALRQALQQRLIEGRDAE